MAGVARPSLSVRIAVLVAGGALLSVLAVISTAVGPWTASPSRPDTSVDRGSPEPMPSIDVPTPDTTPIGPGTFSWRPILVTGAVLAVIAVLALIVFGILQWRRRGSWVPRPTATEPDPEPPAAGPPPPPPATRTFDPRIAADYVIACWEQLEAAALTAGRPRRRHHTPTEFVQALDLQSSDEHDAGQQLLSLYQHARFDQSALAPATVDTARIATATVLAALHGSRSEVDVATAPSVLPPDGGRR